MKDASIVAACSFLACLQYEGCEYRLSFINPFGGYLNKYPLRINT